MRTTMGNHLAWNAAEADREAAAEASPDSRISPMPMHPSLRALTHVLHEPLSPWSCALSPCACPVASASDSRASSATSQGSAWRRAARPRLPPTASSMICRPMWCIPLTRRTISRAPLPTSAP